MLWIIACLLAVIALTLILDEDPLRLSKPALGQLGSVAGARGVYAFAGQFDQNAYGLFMMDVDAGTIWCYEFTGRADERRLKLVAARSWIYDRYLEDLNLDEAGLSPDDVAAYVEDMRQRKLGAKTGATNQAGSGSPNPDP